MWFYYVLQQPNGEGGNSEMDRCLLPTKKKVGLSKDFPESFCGQFYENLLPLFSYSSDSKNDAFSLNGIQHGKQIVHKNTYLGRAGKLLVSRQYV